MLTSNDVPTLDEYCWHHDGPENGGWGCVQCYVEDNLARFFEGVARWASEQVCVVCAKPATRACVSHHEPLCTMHYVFHALLGWSLEKIAYHQARLDALKWERERRQLFFAVMRHPEMRLLRLALLHLSRECEIDWRTIKSIEISSGEFSGCWGFEFNQYYVYASLGSLGIDRARITYQDFSMVDLHWDDLPECLCYACEKKRVA